MGSSKGVNLVTLEQPMGLFLNNEFAFNKIISTLTIFFWSFLLTRGMKVSLLKIKLRPIQRLVN